MTNVTRRRHQWCTIFSHALVFFFGVRLSPGPCWLCVSLQTRSAVTREKNIMTMMIHKSRTNRSGHEDDERRKIIFRKLSHTHRQQGKNRLGTFSLERLKSVDDFRPNWKHFWEENSRELPITAFARVVGNFALKKVYHSLRLFRVEPKKRKFAKIEFCAKTAASAKKFAKNL